MQLSHDTNFDLLGHWEPQNICVLFPTLIWTLESQYKDVGLKVSFVQETWDQEQAHQDHKLVACMY